MMKGNTERGSRYSFRKANGHARCRKMLPGSRESLAESEIDAIMAADVTAG